MEAKLIVVLALVAVAYSAPPPGFSYEVADPNSNDYKSHSESRVGDVVHGHYSVLEPDGSRRIVNYIADEDGFKAVVRKCPAGVARVAAAVTATVSAPANVAARAPNVAEMINSGLYNAEPEITAWPYGSYLN